MENQLEKFLGFAQNLDRTVGLPIETNYLMAVIDHSSDVNETLYHWIEMAGSYMYRFFDERDMIITISYDVECGQFMGTLLLANDGNRKIESIWFNHRMSAEVDIFRTAFENLNFATPDDQN